MTALALAGSEALGLLRTWGALLLRHGAALVGIAALGLLAKHWLFELALVASRTEAVLGMMVFALVPAATFVAIAGMLLLVVQGSTSGVSATSARLAGFTSALLAFLIVYEQAGDLRAERNDYLYATVTEAVWAEEDAVARIPIAASVSVLATIAVALTVRAVGSRVLDRLPDAAARTRGQGVTAVALRLLVAYAEVVWLVLSSFVIFNALERTREWWDTRAVVAWFSEWWSGLSLPDLTGLVDAVGGGVGGLLTAALAGIGVPLLWLTIASIVYGARLDEAAGLSARAARVTTTAAARLRSLTRRGRGDDGERLPAQGRPEAGDGAGAGAGDGVTYDRAERLVSSLTRPEGRWDALGGAVGLVLTRGPLPVLVFCVLFTLASQSNRAVWWVADLVLPTVAFTDWALVHPAVDVVATLVRQVLVVSLVAVGANRALQSIGIDSILRLRGRDVEPEEARGGDRVVVDPGLHADGSDAVGQQEGVLGGPRPVEG